MKRVSLFLFLLLIPLMVFSQSQYNELRKELLRKQENTRVEIDEITSQIDQYEERLVLAEKKYDRLYRQYEDMKRLIALQDQKIEKLESELGHIREEIEITEQEIDQNREHLNRLVTNYKETLTYVYKHGRSSQLAMILSATSVNQMLVRSYYLNKFEDHRLQQAREIRETTAELELSMSDLETARDKNAGVLEEIRSEKQELAERRDLQEQNVRLLQRDREQIENRLSEARRQKEQLDQTLTSLVMEEERVRNAMEARIREMEEERKRKLAAARTIEDDEERAEEIARYSEPVTREEFITDERLTTIEQSFAAQKGTLRWPVESSTISELFGRRRHPVYGTVTESLGIEIVTSPRDTVRVVHAGIVLAVRPIPSFGDVVVVKHGKFITAYGNLSEVRVRKDTVLEEGDIIGLSGDANSAKGESVFFMVREGEQNLNPEIWLANR